MDGKAANPEELLAHMDWVRRLARGLVADAHRVEDVVQETWREALERPPAHDGNLRAWLARVVRNAARQLGRSESSRARRERTAAREEALPSTAELVEQAALQRELVGHVLELDEPYRTTVILRYFRELAPEQIARSLDLPLNTVRSRISRALAQLRERLDAERGGRETWMRALVPLALVRGMNENAKLGTGGLYGGGWSLRSVAVLSVLSAAASVLWLVGVLPSGEPPAGIGSHARSQRPSSRASHFHETAEGRAAAPPRSPAPLAPGEVRIRVVDGETLESVAGLELVLFGERGTPRELARVRTDARGEARAGGLAPGVVLIQSERRPPHAMGFAAVEVSASAGAEAELRVTHGGSVAGRVVDDRGQPLEGVEVLVHSDAAAHRGLVMETPERAGVVAHTDARGRFHVEHLLSLPEKVWLVDGEAQPESWVRVPVLARHGRWRDWPAPTAWPLVYEGRTSVVEDFVLARDARLRGEVRDAAGRAVEGALVSCHPARVGAALTQHAAERVAADARRETARHDDVRAGEALTDAAGRFELVLPSDRIAGIERVAVWTADGRRESFRVRETLAPGEEREVELVLSDKDVLVLSLVGPDGSPAVPLETGAAGHARYRLQGPFQGIREGTVRAAFDGPDGARRLQSAHLLPGGRAVLSVDPALADARVQLAVPGYRPRALELPALRADPVVTLEPLPVLALDLSFEGDESRRPPAVTVHACRAEHPASPRNPCCGLGVAVEVPWPQGAESTLHVELPVLTEEPLHVHVRSNVKDTPLAARRPHGPLRPGPHSLVLRPAEHPHDERADDTFRGPPGRRAPGPQGTLSLSAVDAETQAPLGRAGVVLQLDPRTGRGTVRLSTDAEGTLTRAHVPPQSFDVRVVKAGYEPLELGRVTVTTGETLDLGRVALHPREARGLRLLLASGEPASPTVLEVAAPRTAVTLRDDGLLELRGELPPRVRLRVTERDAPAGVPPGEQWPLLDSPLQGEHRLADFRTVCVRVRTRDETSPHANLFVQARPAIEREDGERRRGARGPQGAPRAARGRSAPELVQPAREGAPLGEARRYFLRLGAGTYELELHGALFGSHAHTLVVEPGDGVQHVDVWLR